MRETSILDSLQNMDIGGFRCGIRRERAQPLKRDSLKLLNHPYLKVWLLNGHAFDRRT
jgi:hypothetical protein